MTPANAPEAQLVTQGDAFDRLGLVHRVLLPADQGAGPHPLLLMLHGLDGNEAVTWIFARTASPQWAIISPRAPFGSPGGTGYRWAELGQNEKVEPASFHKGLEALEHFVAGLPQVYPVDTSRLVLLGFSQGAAMCYAYAAAHRVLGVAALAGLLPRFVADKLDHWRGTPVLMLHGTRDETIYIDHARATRDRLQAAGAVVTYLESDVGHKVSSEGMQALKGWLAQRLEDAGR